MEISSESVAFLAVEGSETASDVLADTLDLGKFSGAAGGGFGISEGPEFFLKFVDVDADALAVKFSDLLIDLLLHHRK